MRQSVDKTCEACGQAFTCVGYQCWCGAVGITDRQMDWIAARYRDCVCPACLKQIADGEWGPEQAQAPTHRAEPSA